MVVVAFKKKSVFKSYRRGDMGGLFGNFALLTVKRSHIRFSLIFTFFHSSQCYRKSDFWICTRENLKVNAKNSSKGWIMQIDVALGRGENVSTLITRKQSGTFFIGCYSWFCFCFLIFIFNSHHYHFFPHVLSFKVCVSFRRTKLWCYTPPIVQSPVSSQ